MPKFAGFTLRSNWGISSDVEIASPLLYKESVGKGASLLFTPTLAVRDPLEDPLYVYPRFRLCSSVPGAVALYTRPLSLSVEEVRRLLSEDCRDARRVLSIAVRNLVEAAQLMDELGKLVEAVELDVGLTSLVSQRGASYAFELAGELAATAGRPLILKVPATYATHLRLKDLVSEAGVSALVVSPNIVYKLGRHFFRLHSQHVSPAALLCLAESLEELDVNIAYVTHDSGEGIYELLPLKLCDAIYLLSWLGFNEVRTPREAPLSWRPIRRGLRVYARRGARFCPYGLIGEGERLVEGCNWCGVCLELNRSNAIALATLLTPETD